MARQAMPSLLGGLGAPGDACPAIEPGEKEVRVREDRATAADIEAATEAIMASYRNPQRGDRKALERQRSTARKQARLALAAVFSEVEDG